MSVSVLRPSYTPVAFSWALGNGLTVRFVRGVSDLTRLVTVLSRCDGSMQLTRLFVFVGRRGSLHEQLCIPLKSVAQRREFAVTEHYSVFSLRRCSPNANRSSRTSGSTRPLSDDVR